MTARRMIPGLVLKYLKKAALVMSRGYTIALPLKPVLYDSARQWVQDKGKMRGYLCPVVSKNATTPGSYAILKWQEGRKIDGHYSAPD